MTTEALPDAKTVARIHDLRAALAVLDTLATPEPLRSRTELELCRLLGQVGDCAAVRPAVPAYGVEGRS